MEKFLLLIREDLKRRGTLTMEDFQQQADRVGEWVDQMAATGNFLDASALYDSGKYVSANYVVSDGPFIEAKESISGFILIQANNLDEATALARVCPLVLNGVAVIEVRRLQDI